jgi:hypothetical protein
MCLKARVRITMQSKPIILSLSIVVTLSAFVVACSGNGGTNPSPGGSSGSGGSSPSGISTPLNTPSPTPTPIGTTGTPNPAAINLGSANNFAVLAGSTVTSTGATAITGDVGIFPGSAITGFPPATYTGTLDAGNATAQQAEHDVTEAYDDAMTRVNSPVTVAGNLGGQTLAPGLYKSTSSLAVSSGNLTLNAGGDPNAVFIFQMASTLTTTSGTQVILSGGATAANVYWAVGSSATLGTGSTFEGNLLVAQSITITTGATLTGRALTQVGAVTLDANTLVMP